MKKWEMPVVEELNISETQHGGTPSMNFDDRYFDDKEALHVTFSPS